MADLSSPRVSNGGVATLTDTLTLSATAPPWSYVLSLDAPSHETDALYVAEVTGRVLKGRFAMGTLLPDGTTIQDERIIDPDEPGPWFVVAGLLRDRRSLLVRTVLDPPAESTLQIEAVRWLRCRFDCDDLFAAPARRELAAVPGWNRYYGPFGTASERLRGVCYDRLEAPRQIPWLFGLRLVLYPRDQMSRAVFVSGLYEPATMLVMRRLVRPGSIVIDAGANVGLMSLVCSRWVGDSGRVLAFEPSSREYRRLIEHLQMNGTANVEPSDEALGASPGGRVLQVADPRYSGLNTLGSRLAYEGIRITSTEEVRVTTVDAAVDKARLARVDVLKIDVEGAEYDVVAGSADTIPRFRPAIVFEANAGALAASQRTLAELAAFIVSHRYHLYAVTDTGELQSVTMLSGTAENYVALPSPLADRPSPRA